MTRSFGGFLHKSGEWVGFENGINTHDDLIRECSDFFGISRSEEDLDSMYQIVFDKGWIRVSNDFGFCVFCFNNSIPIKKAVNAIHNFLTDHRYAKNSKIEIYQGNYTTSGSDYENIYKGTFVEFSSSELFESFNFLCRLVEGWQPSWGIAYWFNRKTGEMLKVPKDQVHTEYVALNREKFGNVDTVEDWHWFNKIMDMGWVKIHDYPKVLSIEVNKRIGKSAMNDVVYDVISRLAPHPRKGIQVFNGGDEDHEYGWTDNVVYQ